MSSFVQDWKCSKCKSDNACYEDFKDKKQTEKMLNENRAKLTNWFLFEMQKYQNAEKNFDQWFTEYTGQSFDEMLNEQASEQKG